MCVVGELDPCSVWRETERTARKPHRCNACWGRIVVQERYVDHFNVFDHDASHEKICLACVAARREFCAEHTDEVLCSGSTFRDLLVGCIAEGDEESDRRWKPMLEAMKAREDKGVQP